MFDPGPISLARLETLSFPLLSANSAEIIDNEALCTLGYCTVVPLATQLADFPSVEYIVKLHRMLFGRLGEGSKQAPIGRPTTVP